MMVRAALIGLVALLAGCETAEHAQARIDADLDARLSGYNGMTIADFQSRTGMLAEDAYPVNGGRVFVFRTAPVFTTLPATHVTPAITQAHRCQLLLHTVATSLAGTADSWQIVGTQRTGGCNNLPVPRAPA